MSAKARATKASKVVTVTEKKSPAKRVAIRKPAPKTSTTKKAHATSKAVAGKKSFAEKLEAKLNNVETFHATKPATTTKTAKALAKVTKKPLVQLSPYRFPIDVDTLARQTARYGGLLFILLGAVFAMSNAHLINLTSVGDTQSASAIHSSASPQSQVANVPYAANQTKPEARFTLNVAGDLTGSVIISVSVPEAQKVDLSVYDEGSRQVIALGSTQLRNGVFEYTWDTNPFKNGQYRIQAIITNQYGTYEQKHTELVTVQHAEVDSDTEIDTGVTGSLELSTDASGRYVTVRQTLPEILTSHTMEIILTNEETGQQFRTVDYLLEYVYSRYNVRWSHVFDTSRYPNGTYRITAVHFNIDEILGTYQAETSFAGAAPTQQPEPVVTAANGQTPVLSISNPNFVSGFREISIDASEVSAIELYAVNRSSNNNILIGVARRQTDSLWSFNWDSRQIPNSQYFIFARVSTLRGVVESNRIAVTVSNDRFVAPSASQLQDMQSRVETYRSLFEGNILLDSNLWLTTDSETLSDTVNGFITGRRDEIDDLFQRYAAAQRSGNSDAITTATTLLLALENDFLATLDDRTTEEMLADEFSSYIEAAKFRINEDVKKVETVIKERADDGIFVDSDNDGITDFDEVFIFGTDPFSADTSRNGIPDGTAILNGLDPLSADIGASIVFESPKDIGIIRTDILKVNSLTPVQVEVDPFISEPRTGFVLTGRGLPNSFVTIYIFSQPTIVTVRTEADGSWQYRFEKELEDGSHSVYVALTDNSGRIIARSQPFFFIKAAQAFTVTGESFTDTEFSTAQSNQNTLLSSSMIYLVISFAVVAVGLILLLLGMYLDARRRTEKSDLLSI
jgi:hypothetical protein